MGSHGRSREVCVTTLDISKEERRNVGPSSQVRGCLPTVVRVGVLPWNFKLHDDTAPEESLAMRLQLPQAPNRIERASRHLHADACLFSILR